MEFTAYNQEVEQAEAALARAKDRRLAVAQLTCEISMDLGHALPTPRPIKFDTDLFLVMLRWTLLWRETSSVDIVCGELRVLRFLDGRVQWSWWSRGGAYMPTFVETVDREVFSATPPPEFIAFFAKHITLMHDYGSRK